MAREYRAVPLGEVRTVGEREFEARICSYNRTDSYGSVWQAGAFADSLRQRLPKAVFSHDWNRPIGSVVDYRDGPEGLDVTVKLADFDAVPDAKMVHALLRDGHFDQFSFGFQRRDDGWRKPNEAETRAFPGATEIMTAVGLDEISPVLIGAVPDTQVLAVRSAPVITPADAGPAEAAERAPAPGESSGDPSVVPLEEQRVTTQLVHDLAVLIEARTLSGAEARHYLENGELPEQPQSGDGSATEQGPPETTPGEPPSPAEPGKQDAPPPVSEPGDGVAVESDTSEAQEPASEPAGDATDADAEGATEDAEGEQAAEQERARALALVTTRGRR